MKLGIFYFAVILASGGAAFAQNADTRPDPFPIAVASGVCGDFDVVSAVYQADGSISAECDDDPVAFIPFLAPAAAALGAALILGASSDDGNAPSGTN